MTIDEQTSIMVVVLLPLHPGLFNASSKHLLSFQMAYEINTGKINRSLIGARESLLHKLFRAITARYIV